MLACRPVQVHRINGRTELVDVDQVAETDWLRLNICIIVEERERAPTRDEALRLIYNSTLERERDGPYTSAGRRRLPGNYRARTMHHAFLHACETAISWKYLEAEGLKTLFSVIASMR